LIHILELVIVEGAVAVDPVPGLNTSATTCGGCVLSVENHASISRSLGTVAKNISASRSQVFPEPRLRRLLQAERTLPDSILDCLLIDVGVPVMVANEFVLESFDCVGQITRIVVIEPLPINEFCSTGDTIFASIRFAAGAGSQETVKIPPTIVA
jgi:hypothetical protein